MFSLIAFVNILVNINKTTHEVPDQPLHVAAARFAYIPKDGSKMLIWGAQWLSGRVLDWRPRGRGFEPHLRHCDVVLEQDTFSLVLVQPRKTRPCLTERLLMGRKESNQTNKQKAHTVLRITLYT